jgi:hypothetical protein
MLAIYGVISRRMTMDYEQRFKLLLSDMLETLERHIKDWQESDGSHSDNPTSPVYYGKYDQNKKPL